LGWENGIKIELYFDLTLPSPLRRGFYIPLAPFKGGICMRAGPPAAGHAMIIKRFFATL